MTKPTISREAHELLIEAGTKRLDVDDGTTPWVSRPADLARTEAMEQAAHAFLTLEPPAEAGTRGELVPQGEGALDLPGAELLVRAPDRTAANASLQRLRLADQANCFDLAGDLAESAGAQYSVERVLLHRMAAAHVMAMRLLGRAQAEMERNKRTDPQGRRLGTTEAVRLSNAATRLMNACQDGLPALHKARSGGHQTVQVVHQHVDARGTSVAVAGAVGGRGGGGSRRDKKGAAIDG